MKKFIPFIALFALTSCAKEWSTADQNQYRNDCMQMAENIPNIEEICNCGLQKAMQNYSSMQQAQKAIQNMSDEETEAFFAECM
ncbi:MAG: hypothetical protein Q4G27_08000 [Flavobacteriaceae bacterium]|nr:hypothetical protein [Flavobacteriaceae bacterium]